MKRIIVSVLLLNCMMMAAFSQGKTTTAKTTPVKKPVQGTPVLCKNLPDSFSYALGVQVANYYKQQGIKKLNTALLTKAINDVYANAKVSFSQNDIDMV